MGCLRGHGLQALPMHEGLVVSRAGTKYVEAARRQGPRQVVG
jgi:hypothetical protein